MAQWLNSGAASSTAVVALRARGAPTVVTRAAVITRAAVVTGRARVAHGATVGRLDETALFYLRSRGLPGDAARRLLVQAFLREPLAMLQDAALAETLGAAVAARLERKDAA